LKKAVAKKNQVFGSMRHSTASFMSQLLFDVEVTPVLAAEIRDAARSFSSEFRKVGVWIVSGRVKRTRTPHIVVETPIIFRKSPKKNHVYAKE